MSGLLIGYAHVSTEEQDLTAQRTGLGELGVEVERLYVDHGLTLLEKGFVPDEPESIMISEAHQLALEVALPVGATLRKVTVEADVRAMSTMADEVFGDPLSRETADALLRRLFLDVGIELWVAESASQIVSTGRMEPVNGTTFAGIWAARPAHSSAGAGSSARQQPRERYRRCGSVRRSSPATRPSTHA